MNMDRRYMVKKFLGEIRASRTGQLFRVYSTGQDGWVLLKPIDRPGGIESTLAFPYKRSDFKRGVLPPGK